MKDFSIDPLAIKDLVGSEFEMICLSRNSVYLHFSRDIMISAGYDCLFKDYLGTDENDSVDFARTKLGSVVEDFEISHDGDLRIVLNSGIINIRNRHLNTESYSIAIEGKEFFI